MSGIRNFWDSLTNVLTGLGTTADPRRARAYLPVVTDQNSLLNAYRGSGNMRKVVDIPALDCVREWRDWQATKQEIEAIEAEEERLGILEKVLQAEIYRGLGGGALILGLPGEPSDPAPAIAKGGIAYIHVVTRWQLTIGEEQMDFADPTYGGPKFFDIATANGRNERIHPSRVIPFRGDPVPNMAGTTWEDRFWGDSRVIRCMDAVKNLDDALANFSALPGRARTSIFSVPGLQNLLATTEGQAALSRRLGNLVTSESLFSATVLDAGDGKGNPGETIEHRQVTWTGIPEVIIAFAEALAAAADIPMTRLWGRAPEGMNSSGNSQQQDWNKMVGAMQELRLKPCLKALDRFLIPSAGVTDTGVWWQFAPLQKPTEKEETERFKTFMEAVEKVQATGHVPDEALAEGLQTSLIEAGWMPGLEAALDKIPEDQRYGIAAGGDEDDPDDLVAQIGRGGDRASASVAGGNGAIRQAANDATPRSLYVSRPVLNVADLQKWATAQGLGELQPDLHVTIAYSRRPLDWMKVESEDWNQEKDGTIAIPPGGVRIVEPLGNRTAVLLFTSSRLTWRHQQILHAGASWDFDDYQPHISLTGERVDLSQVEPYRGIIRLGAERFEEVDEGRA